MKDTCNTVKVKLPAGLLMKWEENSNFPTTNNKDNKSRYFQKEFGNSFKQTMGSVLKCFNLFYSKNSGLNKVNSGMRDIRPWKAVPCVLVF